MKKKTNFFILFIYLFLCTSILPELYVYFLYEKNNVYWCNYYSKKNAMALHDLFVKEDDYLKIYMLYNIEKCDKVKSMNKASIIYYKYNLKSGSNPFALLPLPYIYTQDSLEEVNMQLSKLLDEPIYQKEKDKLIKIEDDFFIYWSNKIYQKTGVNIDKKLMMIDGRRKSFIFFTISFLIIMLLHFMIYKKRTKNKEI